MREVEGVKWVRERAEKPGCIPQGRPKGVRREGVRYENALARVLAASHGMWLEYEDAKGHGYAQVDFVWVRGGAVVAGEAKLTWRPGAYMQLRRLYFPLLRWLYNSPVGGIVVCKNVTRETPRAEVTQDLEEALERARRGTIPVLHWPLAGVV